MLVERARTPESPTRFAGASGPDTMQKIAVGPSSPCSNSWKRNCAPPCHSQLVEAQMQGVTYLAFPDPA